MTLFSFLLCVSLFRAPENSPLKRKAISPQLIMLD
jgi:hypothetical protein